MATRHRGQSIEPMRQRELLDGYLPPVLAPDSQHGQQLLRCLFRGPEAVYQPPGLPVEGLGPSGHCVEDHHAHRRGVDQGLQVGPGLSFLPVSAGVGDHQRRLGGEHDQGLFVLPTELPPCSGPRDSASS